MSEQTVCPKCGFEGDKKYVDKYVTGPLTYITCKMCRRSSVLRETVVGPCVGDIEENLEPKVMFPPESMGITTDNVKIVDGEIVEQKPIDTDSLEVPVEVTTEPLGETISTEGSSTLCPKCDSSEVDVEMSTAKLGYITCRACGYDSKAIDKRHRIE